MPAGRRLLALAWVALCVLSAGCGQDRTAPGQAAADVLRRGNGGDPGSLDPALAEDLHAYNVLGDLYEGLVVATADDVQSEATPGARPPSAVATTSPS
mgnify:CR=1 FL=1